MLLYHHSQNDYIVGLTCFHILRKIDSIWKRQVMRCWYGKSTNRSRCCSLQRHCATCWGRMCPSFSVTMEEQAKVIWQNLPNELGMYRLEIKAGRSIQATLPGRDDITCESVYLSNNLVGKLHLAPNEIIADHLIQQPALFEF